LYCFRLFGDCRANMLLRRIVTMLRARGELYRSEIQLKRNKKASGSPAFSLRPKVLLGQHSEYYETPAGTNARTMI
jgi:hypothetical protein